MSVTLVLDDEIDISRGDVLAPGADRGRPAVSGRRRLDGRTAARSGARLSPQAHVAHRHRRSGPRPRPEQIGTVDGQRPRGRWCSIATPTTGRPGSFILIDPATNFTAGAGMIVDAAERGAATTRERGATAASGSRSGRARARSNERRRGRGRPRVARGDAHMTRCRRALDRRDRARSRGRRPVHHLELPGRMRRAAAHAARGPAGHPGAVPRHRASFPADLRLSRRDRGAVGAEPGQRCARPNRRPGSGRQSTAGLLRPPQGRAALRGARSTTTSGSPACAASSRRRARTSSEVEPFRWRRATCCGRSARSPRGRPKTSGTTRRRTTSRCCRSTSSATPASAASRARRCRSIRPTRDRGGGRDRSWSAGFTSSRSAADRDRDAGTPDRKGPAASGGPRDVHCMPAFVRRSSAPPTRSAPCAGTVTVLGRRSGGGWRSNPTTARRPLRRAA